MTVMIRSDISGISDMSRSMTSRGTSMARVGLVVRSRLLQFPPPSSGISAMNWVGPMVEGTRR